MTSVSGVALLLGFILGAVWMRWFLNAQVKDVARVVDETLDEVLAALADIKGKESSDVNGRD